MRQPPQTKKEAALRMLDGERFIHKGCVIMHKESSSMYSPFVATHIETGHERGVAVYWSQVTEWQPILKWWDDLSTDNKRLCWVHDEDPSARKLAVWIEGRGPKGFHKASGTSWWFATPVLPEDLRDLS